ncbi:MAG: PhzF family phenazine biosynthesis protein [Cyanobacteriota bacterium]|nr:PhzF family phenazine biosynthesis protein [Cyanobacteriota bacterium]
MVSVLPAVLVEAFSETPLGGNGAAVILLRDAAPAAWMQRVAGSLKQSETAFLLPRGEGWCLRWFTPRQEVPLCGHATLAALLALGHWRQLPPGGRTVFHTRSGLLAVQLLPPSEGLPSSSLGQLALPRFALEPLPSPEELLVVLREGLRLAPEACWRSSLGYQVVLLPPAAPLAELRGVAEGLPESSRNGLVLMQALPATGEDVPRVAGQRAEYQLRFFAPGLGIDEDPVTGSAHALVAPYWMERLQRPRVVGWQCSDRPGGMVCEAGSSGMIRLTGSGHLLWEGTLRVEPEHGCAPSSPGADPLSPAGEAWDQACGR